MLQTPGTLRPLFQSTPPVWGATPLIEALVLRIAISIHTPRVGGDLRDTTPPTATTYFNPRPPCGGRRSAPGLQYNEKEFQSTPPVWGATRGPSNIPPGGPISIHAPRVGGDLDVGPVIIASGAISIHAPRVGGDMLSGDYERDLIDFNPRPPCGGRHETIHICEGIMAFQSTPPVWGATASVGS